MNEASKLFRERIEAASEDVKIQVDLMFGVSDKIAGLLKERGMTQKDLAKKMGRTEAEVSRWLSGMHNFTLATIAKITAELGTDILSVSK